MSDYSDDIVNNPQPEIDIPTITSPIDLKKTVPGNLLNQFWIDFLDVISTELNNFKSQINTKANYFDPNQYTDINEVIEFSKSFGYTPNLQLFSDLGTAQREASSIFYKISNKAISNYYYYVFKLGKRIGKVYNAYQDYIKLIRAVDFASTVSNLNNVIDFTLPFIGMIPSSGFTNYQSALATLDAMLLFYFDSINAWFFDNPNQILPTQNLIFEYDIDRLVQDANNNYYTLMPDYFRFLEQSILYGKKASTLPHIGGLLNIITDESIYYDTYDINGTGYSIPSLQLKRAITPFYKAITVMPIVTLDSVGFTFDQEIEWLFDVDNINGLPETIDLLFNQIVIGSGVKNIPSKNYPDINFNLLLYYPFDEEYGTSVLDDSTNGFNGVVSGNYQRIQGIIGKTILYDGSSVQVKSPSISFANSSKTFTFWINPNDNQNFSKARILNLAGYIDVYFEGGTKQILQAVITGSSGNVTLSTTVLAGVNSQIAIEIDTTNHLAILYVDGILVELISITGIGTLSKVGNLYVGSDGSSNYFKGIIDELRIYVSLLTANDLMYLYQNQIGSLRSLSNRLWTGSISFNELYEDTEWKIVNSWAPGLTKNQEFLAQSNGLLQSISGIVDISLIEPGYFTINYISGGGAQQAVDDGAGNILAQKAQGTINYATGQYILNFFRNYEILNFQVPTISNSLIDYFILNLPIEPGTIKIQYTIGGTEYIATDNSNGVITGLGILSGSINYTTGELHISFGTPIDNCTIVFLSYFYTQTLLPDNNTLIFATYKLNTPINVTELGILNSVGQMVLYSTFPPMQFDSIRNHIGAAFHVIKP